MNNTYFDFINQNFPFPQEGFELKNGYLFFYGVSIMDLIEQYGTPFRLTYLPKIGEQIQKADNWFHNAFQNNSYRGKYHFCYCTKSGHFQHLVSKALKHGAHLETSSDFDIELILNLHEKGKIDKSKVLIHNGYKTEEYLQKILTLNELGFQNSIPIFDNIFEPERFAKAKNPIKVGIRMATDLKPNSDYQTSRLGIPANEILSFYKNEIHTIKNLELKMLHFFVDSGIKDSQYFWDEFQKAIDAFLELKKVCPDLNAINLGGGFPIRDNLNFEYDYEFMVNEMVHKIKESSKNANIEEPDIYTEFGTFTVGESGAVIFQVLGQKKQNESELWYIVNNSIMNTIPDSWTILDKYILLPINHWDKNYQKVKIGGLTCDLVDTYYTDKDNLEIRLPKVDDREGKPLYIGFFHTGAYQEALGGFGGITHCLVAAPKHLIIDYDKEGKFVTKVYREQQKSEEILRILGY